MKRFLLYLGFGVLGIVAALMVFYSVFTLWLQSIIVGYGRKVNFQIMEEVLREVTAYLSITMPILVIFAYPVFFFARKKVQYPTLCLLAGLILILLVLKAGAPQILIGLELAKLFAISAFVMIALKTPTYVLDKRKQKLTAVDLAEVF